MYINRWWGEYFGSTDDSLTLLDYFMVDPAKQEYSIQKIAEDFNITEMLDKSDFKTTKDVRYIEDEDRYDINIAIDLIMDLSVLLLESYHSGKVSLKSLDSYCQSDKNIIISAEKSEIKKIVTILRDIANHPMEYDLADMCPEETMLEIAAQCGEVADELEKFGN